MNRQETQEAWAKTWAIARFSWAESKVSCLALRLVLLVGETEQANWRNELTKHARCAWVAWRGVPFLGTLALMNTICWAVPDMIDKQPEGYLWRFRRAVNTAAYHVIYPGNSEIVRRGRLTGR